MKALDLDTRDYKDFLNVDKSYSVQEDLLELLELKAIQGCWNIDVDPPTKPT